MNRLNVLVFFRLRNAEREIVCGGARNINYANIRRLFVVCHPLPVNFERLVVVDQHSSALSVPYIKLNLRVVSSWLLMVRQSLSRAIRKKSPYKFIVVVVATAAAAYIKY